MASVGRRAQDGEAPAPCPTSRGPTHEAAGGEPVFGAEVGRAAPGGAAGVERRGGGGCGRFESILFLSNFPRINISRSGKHQKLLDLLDHVRKTN